MISKPLIRPAISGGGYVAFAGAPVDDRHEKEVRSIRVATGG